MNLSAFKPLVGLTLRKPRAAAQQVIALQLPAQALWTALSLVSIVTSLILAGVMHATLAAPEVPVELRTYFNSIPASDTPLIFALLRWGQAVLAIFVLYWVGRMLGGRGEMTDILAAMTLLQAVSFIGLFMLTVLSLILPFLSAIGMLAFVIWLIWAVVVMLDTAHKFDSPVRAVGVLILSFFGVLVGFSLITGVIVSVFAGFGSALGRGV